MDELIRLTGLGKRFSERKGGGITILRDIDLTLGGGQTLCALGESGCGKTTLGKIIAGLSSYTEGSYLYQGKEVSTLKREDRNTFRNSVQLIHQNPYESLNPTLMVYDILANAIRRRYGVHGTDELYKRVTELLTLVGLTPVEDFVDKYPSHLSGGQRQRVSIARVLAMEPKLIVVDEATSMIDTSLRVSLLTTLREIQEKLGVSYFFITHDLALGRYFARDQRVMIMYLGRIVEEAPTDTLMEHPGHPYSKALLSAAMGSTGILERAQFEPYTLCGADIPSFSHVPEGCALHPRCPEMEKICTHTRPELRALDGGRRVACHRYGGGET